MNDELVLDAGTREEATGPRGPEEVIRPPTTTLFEQVLSYLEEKPDPPRLPSGSLVGREGVAAAALVLRWGSYLSVLLDHDKPTWCEVASADTSRISDQEMARINIESSAALAGWVEVFRGRGDAIYRCLVNRAVAYLPMPTKRSRLKVTEFGAVAEPSIAVRLLATVDASRLERVRTDVNRHPSRVFANALVNSAWRNGPVEAIHGGTFHGYPLDQRRISLAEERELMRFTSERLAFGMSVCRDLARSPGPWSERVLPYGLAEMLLITPSRWTLTESSREVRLPTRAGGW